MGNPYDSMAGAFAAGNEFAMTAFIAATGACVVFPELLLPMPQTNAGVGMKMMSKLESTRVTRLPRAVSQRMGSLPGVNFSLLNAPLTNVPMRLYRNKDTDTAKILEAASGFHESGMAGQRAKEAVEAERNKVNDENWKGEDSDAYTKAVDKYTNRMMLDQVLCVTAAALTAVLGSLCFAYILISMALSVALAAIALAILACLAMSWAFGVSASFIPPLRAAGNAVMRALKTMMKLMDMIMAKVGLVLAIAIGGMTAVVAGTESVIAGNWDAVKDLGNSAVNTVSDLIQKYTAKYGIKPTDSVGQGDEATPPDLTPPPPGPTPTPSPGPTPTPSPPTGTPEPSPTPTPSPSPAPKPT